MTLPTQNTPVALTVHDGHGTLPTERRQLIGEWLAANRINADQVSADHPVSVLTVPYQPPTDDGTPWLLQIIVFHQFYVGPDGAREHDFLTRKPVTFQRTVPLTVPFPATPTTADEGSSHGQADSQAAQEAPEVLVRPTGEAQVPAGHEGQGPERLGEGGAERVEGNPEEDPRQGDEAVPQPEEDQRRPEEAEVAR